MARKKLQIFEKKQNPRFIWADGIRVIAIFLVIYIHQLYLFPPLTFSTLPLWTLQLYSQIGVPLFVLLSGALLLPKEETLGVFFSKRVHSVLLPWVFWVSMYSLLGVTVYGMQFASIGSFLHYEYVLFFSRFWFLPMMFGLYLLTPILRIFVRHASDKVLIYAIGLWFLSIVSAPFAPLLYGQQIVSDTTLHYIILQYVGLYLLGYVLIHKTILQVSIRTWIMILFLSMFATYTATFFDSLSDYPSINRTFSRIFSPTFLPGVIAAYMILYLRLRSAGHISKGMKWFLTEASKSAFGIYLVHELVQECMTLSLPSINNLFSLVSPILGAPLRAMVVFIVSFCIILFLRRIPLLRIVA